MNMEQNAVDHRIFGGGVRDQIRIAALEQKLVSLTYVDAKGKTTIRTVEPYEFKEDTCFAYCVGKQSIRAFKLANILHAQVMTDTYEPRFPILIQ